MTKTLLVFIIYIISQIFSPLLLPLPQAQPQLLFMAIFTKWLNDFFTGIVELVKTLGNSIFEREDEEVDYKSF